MKKVMSVLAGLFVVVSVFADSDAPQFFIKATPSQSITVPASSVLTITTPVWSNAVGITGSQVTNANTAALVSNSVVNSAVLASFTNASYGALIGFSAINTNTLTIDVFNGAVISNANLIGVIAGNTNWFFAKDSPDISGIGTYVATSTNAEIDITQTTVTNVNAAGTVTNVTVAIVTNTASANSAVISVIQASGSQAGTTPSSTP